MAIELRETDQCINFFQQTILRTVRQWQESEAVQQVDVPVLDRNRMTILNIINRGLEYQPSWPELKELVIAMASYMERRGHWDVWQDVLNGTIAMAQILNDVNAEITLTALFARLSQRQSRDEDVVGYYRRVIRLARQSGNKYEEARSCSNLGFFFIGREQWWRAEVLSNHALGIFKVLGNNHGLAHTHNHLGVLFLERKIWGRAEENLMKAEQIWTEMDDRHGAMRVHGNLGRIYNELEQTSNAIKHSELALHHAAQTGEESLSGTFLFNIMVAYIKQGNEEQVYRYAKNAEDIFLKFSNTPQLGYLWHQLCLFHLQNGRPLDANRYKTKALEVYRRLALKSDESQLLADFAQMHSGRKNK